MTFLQITLKSEYQIMGDSQPRIARPSLNLLSRPKTSGFSKPPSICNSMYFLTQQWGCYADWTEVLWIQEEHRTLRAIQMTSIVHFKTTTSVDGSRNTTNSWAVSVVIMLISRSIIISPVGVSCHKVFILWALHNICLLKCFCLVLPSARRKARWLQMFLYWVYTLSNINMS